jgi:AraC-like DNA-binding protein
VEYGAPRDEFLFDREAGQLPITNADPYLNRLLIEVSEETLSRQRRASSSFAARVENAIAPLLPHGKALASKIAADFGMSERTFARRLAEEGLTFSKLLDRLRLELALRYLVDEELAISSGLAAGFQGSGGVFARLPPLDGQVAQRWRGTGSDRSEGPI